MEFVPASARQSCTFDCATYTGQGSGMAYTMPREKPLWMVCLYMFVCTDISNRWWPPAKGLSFSETFAYREMDGWPSRWCSHSSWTSYLRDDRIDMGCVIDIYGLAVVERCCRCRFGVWWANWTGVLCGRLYVLKKGKGLVFCMRFCDLLVALCFLDLNDLC